MGGETLDHAECTPVGLVGDRGYALVDVETGRVASAADPRRWGALLLCRARYLAEPTTDMLPPVLIQLPDGSMVESDNAGADTALSRALGRAVTLVPTADSSSGDGLLLTTKRVGDSAYWLSVLAAYGDPDPKQSARGPIGNIGPIHLVTTASLRRIHSIAGGAPPIADRLRPNLVIEWPGVEFAENAWQGHRLTIADLEIEVLMPTPRCVVPTLPTHDHHAPDRGLLRAAGHNKIALDGLGPVSCLGVYARAASRGMLSVGDAVSLSATSTPGAHDRTDS